MGTKTTLTQKSTLRQHLTPQQVRFVRLLEMTGPEIEDTVRDEVDENPALEAVDPDVPLPDEMDGEDGYHESAEQMQAADYSDEDETPAYLLRANNYSDSDGRASYIDRYGQAESLIDSLNSQLDITDASPRDIAIARYLVGNLDRNGRLSRSLSDIADDISISTGATVTRADLIPALDIIRYQLDPPGLGAVDLRECLLIQLRRREDDSAPLRAAREIIADYFDLFTKKHYEKLQSLLGIDKDTLGQAIALIRGLDPKPGSSLSDASADRTGHITPDFIITPVEGRQDTFSVTLNQRLPELVVEESFRTDPEDSNGRLFVRRKREEANTFIDLIKRRSSTLMAVMKAIVSIQREFFRTEDPSTLRPMTLSDLSDMTGLDKSVISRATAGKYAATQTSVYPLRYFFNDNPTDDSDISSSEILAALKEIIDGENKKKPLSDRALADALKAKGYALARRTVTKYREKNNIPVARLRKEL